MSTPPTAIRLDHVEKRFGEAGRPAVADLSLDIPEGELVALVGPSGCGKTTTLRMINRLEEPTGGRIELGGVDARAVPVARAPPRHRVRHPADRALPAPDHRRQHRHRSRACWAGTRLGPERGSTSSSTSSGSTPTCSGRYPAALSGGQQQRVGVARALAADPPILLMDEPYSAVDPIVRARLQDELVALQRRLRKTVVFVTHDIDEAIKLADRIAILAVGGVLQQYDRPADLLQAPANEFVESFLGRERALRRMALLTVADAEPRRGPRRRGRRDRRRGPPRHGGPSGRLGRRPRRPPAARLGRCRAPRRSVDRRRRRSTTVRRLVVPTTTVLREALDTIVSSQTARRRRASTTPTTTRGMVTIDDIASAMDEVIAVPAAAQPLHRLAMGLRPPRRDLGGDRSSTCGSP